MDIRNKHPPILAQTRNKFPQLQGNTDPDDLILKSMKLPEGEPPIKKIKRKPQQETQSELRKREEKAEEEILRERKTQDKAKPIRMMNPTNN
jgi:hypothetical protein